MLSVENGRRPTAPSRAMEEPGERYGLAGMEERAWLIHATLTTGRTPEGGWRNTLVVPGPQVVGPHEESPMMSSHS